jgi:hydrogenase maturation protease
VLVYGYGNPGRGDDGLGPALALALEQLAPPGTTVETGYQLSVEDAADLAEHEAVIFVDADVSGPEPFRFDRVQPEAGFSFSTHSVAPGVLLALARDLFGKEVPGYTLGIRGYEFDGFRESLSPAARKNLEQALAFLRLALAERRFDEYTRRHGTSPASQTGPSEPLPEKVES